MTVIAMTREMGTLGKDVAQGLADQMGLKVIHHELVEHDLAAHLETAESTVHRYLEGDLSLLEKWKVNGNHVARYTAEEIFNLAKEGNVVIRGWGAAALLHDVPHVLCVRICAPMAFRERVMMERLGVGDVEAVRREIELNDAAHSRTMTWMFPQHWQESHFYHLVLNSEAVPVEACVASLRQLAESPAFQETEESRSVLSDKLLEARIRSALTKPVEGKAGFGNIEVAVQKGSVKLTGVMFEPRLVDEITHTVRRVAGVLNIENNIALTRLRSGGY